jgi:hypothetical protein
MNNFNFIPDPPIKPEDDDEERSSAQAIRTSDSGLGFFGKTEASAVRQY